MRTLFNIRTGDASVHLLSERLGDVLIFPGVKYFNGCTDLVTDLCDFPCIECHVKRVDY